MFPRKRDLLVGVITIRDDSRQIFGNALHPFPSLQSPSGPLVSTFDFRKRFIILEHMFESSIKVAGAAESVADRILSLASAISGRTAQLLTLIEEFDRKEHWRDWGCASTVDWLAWQCGMSRMTAREHVRVARALRKLPLISRSFGDGHLSYSKVRAITRIAEEVSERAFLELARSSTASELERVVRSARRGKAVTDPTYARKHQSVRGWTDGDGMFVMMARFAPDDGAIVWRAIQVAEDAAGVSAETEDPALDGAPPSERRRAGGLVNLARAALSGNEGKRRAAPMLALVHIDDRDGSVRCPDGTPISAASAERLLCDAAIARVTHQPSGRMDVGRATRVIPPALRRALEARDKTCVFPGCSNSRYLDAHHYIPWSRGGKTCQENCGLFCGHHHYLVHEGGWVLIRDERGVVAARSPTGFIIHRFPNPLNLRQAEAAMGWP